MILLTSFIGGGLVIYYLYDRNTIINYLRIKSYNKKKVN